MSRPHFARGRRLDEFCRRLGWSLWPSRCLVCAEPGLPERDLCRACLAAWPHSGPACPQCALPVPAGGEASPVAQAALVPQPPSRVAGETALTGTALYGACLRRRSPLRAVHAACTYRAPVDRLLPRFKFHRDLAAGRLLGAMMGDAFAPLLDHPAWRDATMRGGQGPESSAPMRHGRSVSEAVPVSPSGCDRTGLGPPAPMSVASAAHAGHDTLPVLIPIPLHPRRLRERGYDQALELARPLARRLDLPLRAQALVRARDTAAQSRLDARQRRRNLRGAFAWRGDIAVPAHVVLIDDVMTTGATLHSAAQTLRRAGVLRVDAWVCARVLAG